MTFNTAYAVLQVETGHWWTWAGDWGMFHDARTYDTGPRALAAFHQSTLFVPGAKEEVEIVEVTVRVTSLWCSITT